MTISIEHDNCNGCGKCIKICLYSGIKVKNGKAEVNDRCTACGACIDACKYKAISSDIKEREIPDFSDRNGILVFAEQKNGVISKVTLELLGIGQILAKQLNQKLSAVLLGHDVEHLTEEIGEFGAQNIYLAQHELLAHYQTNPYSITLSEILLEHKPNIFLIGATEIGRDFAPRVSMRLGLGLTADCTELTIDPENGSLLQTRPAFGGNVMATIKTPYSRPQMATVRPGVMQAKRKAGPSNFTITKKNVSLAEKDKRTKILEIVRTKKRSVNLTDAKIIVSGGRGVGSEKGMQFLFALAEVLGGEVAGTRVAVEHGWLSSERQIGQTGQTVRPELYIACGISGAIQHKAGILGSRYIIAINKDERAPIFEVADWGIVGDIHEFVPTLTREFREIKRK